MSDIDKSEAAHKNNILSRLLSKELSNQELVIEILDVNPELQNSEDCVICLVNSKDSVFYPCGHQCLCMPCGFRFKKEAQH